MTLGQNNPIGAFCILCHDADAVLPFYRDVLGFNPGRAEESFYHFTRRGTATALCLWEIGHIARHTVFSTHSETAIPNKFMLSLTIASVALLEEFYKKLTATNTRILLEPSETGDGYSFHFIDPCAVIWEVAVGEVSEGAGETMALGRISLLCQDLATTKAFYEDKLDFPSSEMIDGRVIYPPIDQTELSLWDAQTALITLGLSELDKQQHLWSATTAMLAYSFEMIDQVQSLYGALSDAGIPFDEPPARFDWDFSACYFRDPENNVWELFEVPSNIDQRMLSQTG